MGARTKIAWCDSTVNFWSGCAKVSAGCAHCYAETLAKRFAHFGQWGAGQPRRWHESALRSAAALNRKPWVCDCGKSWSHAAASAVGMVCAADVHRGVPVPMRRRRVFVNSLSDLLDEEVPSEMLAQALAAIWRARDVQWILCSKRWHRFMEAVTLALGNDVRHERNGPEYADWLSAWLRGHPPANVVVLASVENQAAAEERIPALLQVPAVVRGLSCEPLLGPVDLQNVRWKTVDDHHGQPQPDHYEDVLRGGKRKLRSGEMVVVPKVDWLIVGGESGSQARACNVDWVRALVRQGQSAGVPVLVKQLGAKVAMEASPEHDFGECLRTLGRIKERAGGNPDEWPEDLRVRQWPVVVSD